MSITWLRDLFFERKPRSAQPVPLPDGLTLMVEVMAHPEGFVWISPIEKGSTRGKAGGMVRPAMPTPVFGKRSPHLTYSPDKPTIICCKYLSRVTHDREWTARRCDKVNVMLFPDKDSLNGFSLVPQRCSGCRSAIDEH